MKLINKSNRRLEATKSTFNPKVRVNMGLILEKKETYVNSTIEKDPKIIELILHASPKREVNS